VNELDFNVKVPPHSIEAEITVLGAMLLDERAVPKAIELLRPQHFYKETHRKIFLALCELFEKNIPTDLLALREELKKRDELETVGGTVYLSTLVNSVATAANIEYYAGIIKEKASKRAIIMELGDVISDAYDPAIETKELLIKTEKSLFNIQKNENKHNITHVSEIVDSVMEKIEKLLDDKIERCIGIPTGLRDIDNIIRGVRVKNLVVIAGRPGRGKSAFMSTMAINSAIINSHKYKNLIFSIEMTQEEIVMRMLSELGLFDPLATREGYWTERFKSITDAADRLRNAPIWIDDSRGKDVNALNLRSKIMQHRYKHGVDIVYVDHLQRIPLPPDKYINEASRRGMIVSELKNMAGEFEIPIILLSQLNRDIEKEHRQPLLSDLRDTGITDHEADLVLMLWEKEQQTEILIAKNRMGGAGKSIKVKFNKAFTLFEDADEDYNEERKDIVN